MSVAIRERCERLLHILFPKALKSSNKWNPLLQVLKIAEINANGVDSPEAPRFPYTFYWCMIGRVSVGLAISTPRGWKLILRRGRRLGQTTLLGFPSDIASLPANYGRVLSLPLLAAHYDRTFVALMVGSLERVLVYLRV